MSKLKICIDPGHGGTDPGAINSGYEEKAAALAIALKVGKKLSEKGASVIYTRTKDEYPTLAQRCQLANAEKVDAFISIHLNAAYNKTADGIETWRYEKVGNTTKALAEKVQAELIKATGAKDRGVKATTGLYVLRRTVAPAILIETGFISNDAEAKKLFNAEYQNKLAEAIVTGIYKVFK